MGLPVSKFVASTNINDVVPEYLVSGQFQPRTSEQTISNAMDVGNPSNFARILDLFQNNFDRISEVISGYAFNDEETREAMRQVFANGGYMMDPHGAVAYLGLKKYLKDSKSNALGVFAETAHPAKFREVVQQTLSSTVEIPEKLLKFMSLSKKTIPMAASYDAFRTMLIDKLV